MKQSRSLMKVCCLIGPILLFSQSVAAKKWDMDQDGPKFRDHRIDIVGASALGAVGGAVWYVYPLLPRGFISDFRDSFDLEFGCYLNWFAANRNYLGVQPAIASKWGFHVAEDWTLFASLKLGLVAGVGADELYPVVGSTLGA